MRVLVCGGRNFRDKSLLTSVLDELHKVRPIDVLGEGDAQGADRLAGFWARKNGIDNLKYPANWDRYGRAAGPIRNREMLESFKPHLVVAFPGGTGTANMVDISKSAKVEIFEVGKENQLCLEL